MDPVEISERAIKDYCFDYDEKKDEVKGPSYRNTNPKKLVDGINLKDLFNEKEVLFEISKGYDEDVLEQEDPDVFNDIIYTNFKHLQKRRGVPALDCSFKFLATKMFDLTENGFVKKQIITNGVGDIVPEYSYVTVEYNFYKESCEMPFDSTYLRNSREKFRLDQVETILGLNYAVKSMRKCENSRFLIKWQYAFGALGCPDRIEPKCDILADVTLIDFVEIAAERDLSNLSESEILKYNFQKCLNKAKQHHVNGSEEFKRGNIACAIKSYRKGLRILNDLKLADEEEEKAMLKQKVKCLVNLALCYNKLGKFEQACLACQDALSIDYNNVKAFFHYGRASLGLSNFSAARKWLIKAAKLQPHDKDINMELKKLNDKKSFQEAVDKEFWGKAFEQVYVTKEKKDEKLKK